MKATFEDKVCAAALRLAAKQGWASVTLEAIAKAAKIPPAQIKKQFTEKNRILPAIVRLISVRTASKIGKIDPRAAPHDRLFEVMMARFDALQEQRAGILSILAECRRDPATARLIVPEHMQAMQKMRTLAKLEGKDIPGPLANAGLLTVYYRGLWCWQKDPTKDMAKTMAALDQSLRWAGKLAEILFKNRKAI